MTISDEQIILHTTKFSEDSLVVHALSRQYGRRSFLVRKPRMSLFQPLNIVEADVVENPKSSLYLARNYSSFLPLNGLRSNISKNLVSLFLGELLFKGITEGAPDEQLYLWCRERVLLFDAMGSDYASFHLKFMLEFCEKLGFAVTPDSIIPFAGKYLDPICSLAEKSFPEAMLVPLNGQMRSDIAESLISYLEFHLERAINIRSLEVLRDLF